VRDYREWKRRSTSTSVPSPTITGRPTFDLDAAVQAGDLDAILGHQPTTDALTALAPHSLNALHQLVEGVWWDASTNTSPLLRIERTAPRHWTASRRDFELAQLGLQLRLHLREDEWFKAVEVVLTDPEQERGIGEAFDVAWTPRLVADLTAMDDDVAATAIRSIPGCWSDDLAEAIARRAFASRDEDLRALAARRLAEEGRVNLLAAVAQKTRDPAIDRVLCEHGDAEAELRLLGDLAESAYPRLGHWDRAAAWIDCVRQPTSATAVEHALRVMLRRGDDVHELAPLFRALERCSGETALEVYNDLIEDPIIPSAAFLWYRKQQFVAAHPPPLTQMADVAADIFGIDSAVNRTALR
jgi:hypothetical protein